MKISTNFLFLLSLVLVAGIGAGCLYKGINGAVMLAVIGSSTAIASNLGVRSGAKEALTKKEAEDGR